MRILVTGGRGTIGLWLVRELRQRGHTIITSDIAHDIDELGFSVRTDVPAAAYVRCDVAEYRQLERAIKQLGPFDLVYHTAAEFGRWNGEDFYESMWRTNAVGTKNVIRLQEQHRFKLVHFSSSEVYGDWPELMVESVPDCYAIHQQNDYAMSKWVNEMQIRNSIEQHKTETVIVRLFNTYGPGERPSPYRSVNSRFLHCALVNTPFYVYRGHERTSTFVADTVRTLANIAERFRPGGVYNIGGAHMHTIEELAEAVLQVTGADPSLVRYAGPESLTTKTKRVDTSRAVSELGHQNTYSLEEGLRITAEWMQGMLKERVIVREGCSA